MRLVVHRFIIGTLKNEIPVDFNYFLFKIVGGFQNNFEIQLRYSSSNIKANLCLQFQGEFQCEFRVEFPVIFSLISKLLLLWVLSCAQKPCMKQVCYLEQGDFLSKPK